MRKGYRKKNMFVNADSKIQLMMVMITENLKQQALRSVCFLVEVDLNLMTGSTVVDIDIIWETVPLVVGQ